MDTYRIGLNPMSPMKMKMNLSLFQYRTPLVGVVSTCITDNDGQTADRAYTVCSEAVYLMDVAPCSQWADDARPLLDCTGHCCSIT